eukprot:CAMPEP_0174819276 /NCGR_PEP_ID=MMETSP1107-20130205/2407_1 /TAXON_ID=36770 /ORGANISM="Paraphysomonas vestita, Strain GFlagA" /LENGTH=520 /DNA_ID=CAMNT_0016032459 /DNA_START=490 /DNA_END=2052 /DNA_ORIENTATION=-
MANRTIESLRQGMAYDENGMPISKQGFIGSGDDSTVYASDDSLSVGGGMGMSGIGGDYYGGLDDLSGSHSQLGNWSQQPPPSNRQQQQSQSQQSHLFPRGINSPDSDIYGYNPGVGSIGLGGGVGVGGNGVSGGGDINRGYFADNEPSIRGPPPSSLSDGRGSGGGGGGGIGGLFTSSSTSSSSSIPSVSTSSNQHFPSRGVPSHGLVYGGRFVLESAGEDPPSLYPRDDYQVDRSGSYDLTRADRESDEYNQHSGYLDDPSSQIPGQSQSQVNAANATTSKRLSPSAPSFMPGSTSLQGNLNKNNVTQLGSVGNSPVTRSNSSSSQSNNNNNNINNNNHNNTVASSSSSSSILNPSVDFNQNPPPPPGFESYSTSRDPFYEDGQQIITNPIDPSSNSSLSNIGLEVDSSSSIILNDKDNYDGQLSSPPLSLQTNEAGTVSVINQMRLQSKSSKLDAKPLLSSPTSPTTTTSNSSSSSSNITNNNNNNNNFNIIPSSSLSNPLPSNSSSFPPSNLYSEGL